MKTTDCTRESKGLKDTITKERSRGKTDRTRQTARTNQFRAPRFLFKASKISAVRQARDIRESHTVIHSA